MSTEMKVPRLLRVKEVAQMTGIASWRLYELLKKGEGPRHLRIGKTIRFPEDALVKWIEQQSSKKDGDR